MHTHAISNGPEGLSGKCSPIWSPWGRVVFRAGRAKAMQPSGPHRFGKVVFPRLAGSVRRCGLVVCVSGGGWVFGTLGFVPY